MPPIPSIGETIGWTVCFLLVSLLLFNGLIMLISPARWFTLPLYLSFRGSLNQSRYRDTLPGRLQVRILGLGFAAVGAQMLAGLFNIPIPPQLQDHIVIGAQTQRWLGIATALGCIGYGAVMLLNPKWWIAKYFKEANLPPKPTALEWILRLFSLIFIGAGCYFLTQFIASR